MKEWVIDHLFKKRDLLLASSDPDVNVFLLASKDVHHVVTLSWKESLLLVIRKFSCNLQFLDAIASPNTFPGQWVSQYVSERVSHS